MVSFVMILVDGVGSTKLAMALKKIDVGLGDIVEGTCTKNQVAPPHEALIGSLRIVADFWRLL